MYLTGSEVPDNQWVLIPSFLCSSNTWTQALQSQRSPRGQDYSSYSHTTSKGNQIRHDLRNNKEISSNFELLQIVQKISNMKSQDNARNDDWMAPLSSRIEMYSDHLKDFFDKIMDVDDSEGLLVLINRFLFI